MLRIGFLNKVHTIFYLNLDTSKAINNLGLFQHFCIVTIINEHARAHLPGGSFEPRTSGLCDQASNLSAILQKQDTKNNSFLQLMWNFPIKLLIKLYL